MTSALPFMKQRNVPWLCLSLSLSFVTKACLLGICCNSRYPSNTLGEVRGKIHHSSALLYLHNLGGIFLGIVLFIQDGTNSLLFTYLFSLPSCPGQEVKFVILPVKNHLVLYFENKETSYPIHMVNINIILSINYTGILFFFFFILA